MAKVDIWMPVFIGDYLRDTQELDAEEHGAYMLLLMHYWLKKGDIGSDVSRLSRVARSTEETTRYILETYFTHTNDGYRNKRADEEMSSAESRRAAATENGKKGGRPQKENPPDNPEKTHRFSDGKPEENRKDNPEESSSPSSSSSPPHRSSPGESPPRSASVRIDSAIKHWNSQPNLPSCKYMSATLPELAEVTVKFNTFTEEEIHQAVESLNKCWKKIERQFRPTCFHKFLIRSLDSWLPSVKPEDKYFKNNVSETPAWQAPEDDRPEATEEEATEAFTILGKLTGKRQGTESFDENARREEIKNQAEQLRSEAV